MNYEYCFSLGLNLENQLITTASLFDLKYSVEKDISTLLKELKIEFNSRKIPFTERDSLIVSMGFFLRNSLKHPRRKKGSRDYLSIDDQAVAIGILFKKNKDTISPDEIILLAQEETKKNMNVYSSFEDLYGEYMPAATLWLELSNLTLDRCSYVNAILPSI